MAEDSDNVTALRRSTGTDVGNDEAIGARLEGLRVTLSTLAQRIDSLGERGPRAGGSQTDLHRAEVLAEMRAVLEAQERMNRMLADTFAQLDRTQIGLAERLGRLAEAVDVLVARDPTADIASLRDQLLDVASGEVVGALWDELHRFRTEVAADVAGSPSVDPVPSGTVPAASVLPESVVEALGELRDRFDAGLVVESDRVEAELVPETMEELRREIRAAGTVPAAVVEAMRAELVALRRRIAVKADEQVLDAAQIDALAAAVAARLAHPAPAPDAGG